MDRLRQSLGLMAKHLNVQIAQLITPEFSNGLPVCLIGNKDRSVNIGLKSLQLCANSIMPYLVFLGQSMADKFPMHAEQYNQNINSMEYMSALLAPVDLRAKIDQNTYDLRLFLSKATIPTYEAVRTVIQADIDPSHPYIWDDDERSIDKNIAQLTTSLTDEKGPLLYDQR
ncbi:unnamed protein product [Rotaria sp. Silwood2]|nr:unnamed protein product [Rotaria sp. Silwood2]